VGLKVKGFLWFIRSSADQFMCKGLIRERFILSSVMLWLGEYILFLRMTSSLDSWF